MRAADTRGELIEIYEALGEREQARRHAEAARDELRGLGADDEAAKYEAWLAGQ